MKTKLLNQVAVDNPEGMGKSSKGWDVLVDKLKASGPKWQLLTTKCARENVREMLREWHKNQTEVDKTTGTGANVTEDDAFLQENFDLWNSRKEEMQKRKNNSSQMKEKKSTKAGLQLRQAATQGLKRAKACEQDDGLHVSDESQETETSEISVPAKRQRKQALWSYLKEVKLSENSLKDKELDLRAKQMVIDVEKVKIEKERLRLQSVQQEQQLQLQREQQQQNFRLQQQQMEAMLSLLKK
ncbi:GRB10-interacting GYF protein 2-like [Patiria miniata]|uniref:Uncharacterized protein n=1 Tax=Patiria miniata TaxID=46514 RepID=A0A914AI26_PATMI|nr:GRB10-interacting GYF protein 2-like [Patiria miniata]